PTLLADPLTGTILGAHIVGPEAAELIHELISVMYFHGGDNRCLASERSPLAEGSVFTHG
ncbi:MAG: hypothetical protein ACE1ZW_06770, partial [Nitrospirales bacterium]